MERDGKNNLPNSRHHGYQGKPETAFTTCSILHYHSHRFWWLSRLIQEVPSLIARPQVRTSSCLICTAPAAASPTKVRPRSQDRFFIRWFRVCLAISPTPYSGAYPSSLGR